MSRFSPRITILLCTALVCSGALTILTLMPPMIPDDWARLDSMGIYVPQRSAYHWSSYVVQVALWLAMVAALWWGAALKSPPPDPLPASQGGGDEKRGRDIPQGGYALSRPYGAFWVVLVTLVGFGLRVYSLTRLPLIVDEIGFAAHASDILHGELVPIFAPGHNANPSTYSWLVAGAMAIFGQNTFAIRLVPLAFGTLTIPAAYVLGREWWSKRVGFVTAAFVATFPLHVFYSRMSLYNIADPFFAMLALALLARGLNSHQPTRYFVLAGMLAGIAQDFYHGSRLVPVLMAVYLLLEAGIRFNAIPQGGFAQTQRDKDTKRLSVNSLWMLFAFGVMALPRYGPLLLGHLPITGNSWAMRLPNDMGDNTARAFLAWVGQRDMSPFWMSDQPMLILPALLALLLGVWFCLRHWRDPRSIVLLLSIVLTSIFGGAIWTAAPLYVRYMATLPTIALLVAVGVEQTFLAVKSRGKEERNNWGRFKILPYAGVLLMVVIVGYGSYVSVFVHPEEAFKSVVAGMWEEDALARQAAHQPTGFPVVLEVSPEFDDDPYYGPLELMSIADYVAAYGERRTVIVNQYDTKRLEQQIQRLRNPPYAIVQANPP